MKILWRWHDRRGCMAKSWKRPQPKGQITALHQPARARPVWDWGRQSPVFHLGPIKLVF